MGLGSGGQDLGLIGFRVYLHPKEPTFLGFLIMISLYEPLKRVGSLSLGFWGLARNPP